MKILHLVSQDFGGAGRAALRLHLSLLALSELNKPIESIMLVQDKSSDSINVLRLAKTKPQKIMEKLRPLIASLPLLFYPKRHKDIFSANGLSNNVLLKAIEKINPDIVHLHWINNGFFNIKDLKKIKAPLIWSLHDANAYTGGCHIVPTTCIQVGNHCKKCPLLDSKFSFDLSYHTFETKNKTYKNLNLTINGLSHWISQCAKNSALLKNKKIINLPNPINTELYCPINKDIALEILKLSNSKKTIVFGAINATAIGRKGYVQLKEALKILKNKQEIRTIIFGASKNGTNDSKDNETIETHYLGYLHDDISLKLIYNAADIVIVPSLAENLSNTIMESLSCGTPVVAFDTGGNSDMIEHQKNGYLAKKFDCNDLAKGIEWILNLSPASYKLISQNARKKVLEHFESSLVAKMYIKAYEDILGGGGGQTNFNPL